MDYDWNKNDKKIILVFGQELFFNLKQHRVSS